MSIAVVPTMADLPTYVAYEEGFFEDVGLDVTLYKSSSGKMSLDKIIDKTVDIGFSSQTPVMYKSFTNDSFKIIASNYTSAETVGILVRKSAEIKEAIDIQGKRIGLLLGSSSDFHLDTYLNYHGIDPSAVELVNLGAEEVKEAMRHGEIDVMFSWEPHLYEIELEMGEDVIRLSNDNLNTMVWLGLTSDEFIENKPEAIEKFLAAIDKANAYIEKHPEKSLAIYSKMTDSSVAMNTLMFKFGSYGLGLTEEVLIILEDQARWALRTDKIDSFDQPNYLKTIYFKGLEEVKPKSISIIH